TSGAHRRGKVPGARDGVTAELGQPLLDELPAASVAAHGAPDDGVVVADRGPADRPGDLVVRALVAASRRAHREQELTDVALDEDGEVDESRPCHRIARLSGLATTDRAGAEKLRFFEQRCRSRRLPFVSFGDHPDKEEA